MASQHCWQPWMGKASADGDGCLINAGGLFSGSFSQACLPCETFIFTFCQETILGTEMHICMATCSP